MSKWHRYRITATLRSDAHFGSGAGGQGLDALVARDRDEHPVIWASHVEGVLRDAAFRLKGEAEAQAFFGKAGSEVRQQAVFSSLYSNSKKPSHIWRSTARESFDNSAPKADTLRAIEYVPQGTEFEGTVELPESQVNIFQRLLQEVDALGKGRASGSGRLSLQWKQEAPTAKPRAAVSGGVLRLLLRNVDPLSLSATATPDNIIPTLSYVPGRTLLGALAAWLLAQGEQALAEALVTGQLSVSDALPLPKSFAENDLATLEVLPSPLALQHEKPKGQAGPQPWWTQASTDTEYLDAFRHVGDTAGKTSEGTSGKAKLKRPAGNLFVYRAHPEQPWQAYKPLLRTRLRNGRAHPNQKDPSLFAIEQIVEKTYFYATLEGKPEDLSRLAQGLHAVLSGQRWIQVGRSGAPVEVVKVASVANPKSCATPHYLTLCSDLLLRDESLRWRTTLTAEALGFSDAELTLKKSPYEEHASVHGFNGTSRLWRLPASAIRRGSVYEVSGPALAILAERIAQQNWLGERTHEGFGRFRLDEHLPGFRALTPHKAPTLESLSEEEEVAQTTYEWFEEASELKTKGPSLAQWFDLVADLDAHIEEALTLRQHASTRGGKVWPESKAASEILDKLSELSHAHRALYARTFVRWLRTAKKEESR